MSEIQIFLSMIVLFNDSYCLACESFYDQLRILSTVPLQSGDGGLYAECKEQWL